MDKNSPTIRASAGRRSEFSTVQTGQDENTQGHLPGGARQQGPAAGGLLATDQPVLRADQPRLHGLRAVQGVVHRGSALCRARRCRCSRRRAATAAWATSSPGMPRTGKIVWSKPEKFSVWSGALATAGGVVFYGTLEGYLKAVDAKDGQGAATSSRLRPASSATCMTYSHNGKQYVAVLSGVGGWAGIGLAAGLTNPTDGLGARRRLRGPARLHGARRRADGVHAAVVGERQTADRRGMPAPVCRAEACRDPKHQPSGLLVNERACIALMRRCRSAWCRASASSRQTAKKENGRQMGNRRRHTRPTTSPATARSTGTFSGFPPVPFRVPRLPRAGRRRLELCAGPGASR